MFKRWSLAERRSFEGEKYVFGEFRSKCVDMIGGCNVSSLHYELGKA